MENERVLLKKEHTFKFNPYVHLGLFRPIHSTYTHSVFGTDQLEYWNYL